MPHIVMCGCPCSGKTTRTKQLNTYLSSNTNMDVKVIADSDFVADKNEVYAGKFCAIVAITNNLDISH